MTDLKPTTSSWLVYMIEADNGSLYTGITTDFLRRWQQHCSGRGARYFRLCRPRYLRLLESHPDRRCASQRENQLKKLSRQAKWQLITNHSADHWPEPIQALSPPA